MSAVTQALTLVAFPVAAAAAGTAVSIVRPPGPRLVSAIQHFAAGVVVAALAGEVLPSLRREGNLPYAVIGFTAGVAVMLAMAAYSRRQESASASQSERTRAAAADMQPRAEHARGLSTSVTRQVARRAAVALPLGLLVAVGVDLVIDGLLVGLGAVLGSAQGIIITLALTLEILFLSLSLGSELTEAGLNRGQSAATVVGLALLTAVGAVGGAALLAGAGPATLAVVLAFGAAALLYLAVEELLVEAHEQIETTALAAMFFLGFLAVYVLGEIAS
ncbi:membrane protein [Intrasporangium chromatireducens Q5-1]|uniref:Membrane protein n=1 Tax=Intrasporangium chromatireducens Q5-1 TaxID=584657 RepID=W9GP07_9MICO|nr:ZIP family metal transporter [Intrasporangium chromatireducens]EWT05614.1 membrane protein [Intrasporangium chromatireducens Q5-1]